MIKCHQDCLGNRNPDKECMSSVYVILTAKECIQTDRKWESVEESNVWFCTKNSCKNYELLDKSPFKHITARGVCLKDNIFRTAHGICESYEK